jgi:hypothetical protein
MQQVPIAYHITFGTYGTRLHGDERGTVCRSENQPGDPIIGSDPTWWMQERNRLTFDPVYLDREKMVYAERVAPDICVRGKWQYHMGAAGPDHFHILLTPDDPMVEGDAIRKWFKRWLGQEMSKRWPLPDEATWWSEGGSVRWVWTQKYFDNVYGYLARQRATPAR